MAASMSRWVGKTAVVTGASSGIGEAIAKALVTRGVNVVGLARRKDRLDAMSSTLRTLNGTFHPFTCDLTSEQSILSAFNFTKTLGPVHILINNAGVSPPGSLIDGNTESWRKTFDVNVLGLCIATREAVRDMRANGVDGHVVHVNSVAGHVVPGMRGLNVYPASKFAVTALAGVLRQELDDLGSKIKVTSVSPGLVKTDIFDLAERKFPDVEDPLLPEDVAESVVYALSTPKHVQIEEITVRCIEVLKKKQK